MCVLEGEVEGCVEGWEKDDVEGGEEGRRKETLSFPLVVL